MRLIRTLTLCFVLSALTLAAKAKDAVEHIVVGQTVHVTLDKQESHDDTISLPKGDYYIGSCVINVHVVNWLYD